MMENTMQTSLFDFAYPSFRFTKPIRVIELFAGYGSQMMAFERLSKDGLIPLGVESYKICEWAIPSFVAWAKIHASDDKQDYSEGKSKEDLARILCEKGASLDWKTPASLVLLKRKPEKYLRDAFNAMIASNNVVDITRAKGSDFAMVERERYQVVMTWSFPCQSLSLAGKRAGMDEGSGSESSLGYEVLRILDEMKIINQLPTILVMENVPQFASKTNRTNIIKIQDRLGKLGYKSYIDVQSATDFGVPQTRKRCFMISILGDYSYQFPIPYPLKKKLKDVLEQNVPEKYYLSDKMVKYVLASGTKNYHPKPGIDPEIGRTVNTSPASHRSGVDNYITDDVKKDDDQHKIVLEDNGQEASYSLTTANNLSGLVGISDDGKKEKAEEGLPIRDATSKGFAIAHDGDGVYIQNMTNKRGTVQKGKVPTIKAGGQDVGVVVKGIDKSANNPKEIEVANCITAREDRGVSKHEGEGTAVLEIGSYTPSGISGKVVDPKGVATTLTTGSHGNQTGVVEPKLKQIGNIYPDRENFKNPTSGRVYDKEGVSPTINTMDGGDRQPMVAIGMAQRTRGQGRLPKGDEHRQQEIESNGGEVSNSITTVQKDSLVAEVLTKERTELGKKKRKEYENHETDLKRSDVSKLVPRKDGCSNTLTTVTKDNLIAEKKPICLNPKGGRGGVEGLQPSVENRVYSSEGTATAATTSFLPNYMDLTLQIRKLTSRECFRLQDVLDSDYDKIKDLFPESILYHLAGDSICVANLYFIFKMMFTESWTSSAH